MSTNVLTIFYSYGLEPKLSGIELLTALNPR